MGINGLIPFVKNATREVNIRNFSGCVVAIDAYCWLHKGAYSCAQQLVQGQKTDGYVRYCMKMVNAVREAGLTPIMVFDGCNLPSKARVEAQRRERRSVNRKAALECLRQGRTREAREYFTRCIDITSDMALEVMQACRKEGIDCIVAPYEADAQLAYLSKCGIAQLIITEDSDLILYGCERVLFKMVVHGQGLLVEKSRLHLAMGVKAENFTFDKFRYMCILSGCDYLPSLPGIGLKKACKFFAAHNNPDLYVVLNSIPSYLRMNPLVVTKEYKDGFIKANNTFLYQLVFDPQKRKQMPLNPYPPDMDLSDFDYAGLPMTSEHSYQLALGNINIATMKKIHDFDPDRDFVSSKRAKGKFSIWDPNYKVTYQTFASQKLSPKKRTSLTGIELVVPVGNIMDKIRNHKRPSAADSDSDGALTDDQLLSLYKDSESENRPKRCKASICQLPPSGEGSTDHNHTCIPESPSENSDILPSAPPFVSNILTPKREVTSRYFASAAISDLNVSPNLNTQELPEISTPESLKECFKLNDGKTHRSMSDTEQLTPESVNYNNDLEVKKEVNYNPFRVKSNNEDHSRKRSSSRGVLFFDAALGTIQKGNSSNTPLSNKVNENIEADTAVVEGNERRTSSSPVISVLRNRKSLIHSLSSAATSTPLHRGRNFAWKSALPMPDTDKMQCQLRLQQFLHFRRQKQHSLNDSQTSSDSLTFKDMSGSEYKYMDTTLTDEGNENVDVTSCGSCDIADDSVQDHDPDAKLQLDVVGNIRQDLGTNPRSLSCIISDKGEAADISTGSQESFHSQDSKACMVRPTKVRASRPSTCHRIGLSRKFQKNNCNSRDNSDTFKQIGIQQFLAKFSFNKMKID